MNLKRSVLKEILDELDGRVLEQDIKPLHEKKAKLIIKAEGDSPEEAKEEVLEKLSKLELPGEEDMPEMEEELDEEMPEEEMLDEELDPEMEESEDEEEDEDFLDSLPPLTRKKYLERKEK